MSAYSMQKMWTFLAYWGVFVPSQIPPAYGPDQVAIDNRSKTEKLRMASISIISIISVVSISIYLRRTTTNHYIRNLHQKNSA